MSEPFSRAEDSDWGKKVTYDLDSLKKGEWDGRNRRLNGNGGMRLALTILAAGLTALTGATGWTITYMLDTRTMAVLNTAAIAANTANTSAMSLRITIEEQEIRKIALTQAERTAIVQRMQQIEERRR